MKAIIKVICLIYLLALLFPLYSYAGPKEDYEFQEHCGKRAAEIYKIFSGSGMSQDKGEDRVSNYTCHYNKKSDTPRRAGGLMNGAASKAVGPIYLTKG